MAPRRLLAGWLLALTGVPLLTLALAQTRDEIGLPTVLLVFLAQVVLTAAVGGTLPALVAAIAAFLAANWNFTPPYHRWIIADGENVVALVVFLGVALVVSGYVDAAARRAAEAAWARSQAQTLARLAATMGEHDPLPTLLDHVRSVFGLDSAAVLRNVEGRWQVEAGVGTRVPEHPDHAHVIEELTPDVVLALDGADIQAEDQLVLNAFAAQLAVVIEHGRLQVEADRARVLADANALRSALLQAVSHDLRTPLAAIKASASSLAEPEIQWSPEDTADFVCTINEQTDRLTTLVGNLLDMSRVHAGALSPTLRPVGLEEVVPAAVAGLARGGGQVEIDLPETAPPVLADAALLERALANIIDNAVRHSPPHQPVRVEAGTVAGQVAIRVIDRGTGIPADDRERVFQPFQRLGDNPAGTGVGLGLAVAHGFLTAMGATIEIDDTPGGGTTIFITIPAASAAAHSRSPDEREARAGVVRGAATTSIRGQAP